MIVLVASTLLGLLSAPAEYGTGLARAEQPIIIEPPAVPTVSSQGGSGGSSSFVPPLGDPFYFAETGFSVDSGVFRDFFAARGGAATFGPPLSNSFTLLGRPVQIFRNHVLELRPDGSVGALALLDSGAIPATQLAGRAVPARDETLAVSPPASDPNWRTLAQTFVQANAPDVWQGLAVGFYQEYLAGANAVGPETALDVWGVPTSRVARDPSTPDLVHLRWERGVMEYDARTGQVQAIPLGEVFKSVLTGEGLPAELASEVQGSRYYRQYNPSMPNSLARPDQLPSTSLARIFEPNAQGGGPPANAAAPLRPPVISAVQPPSTPTPTPTPIGDVCVGDEQISYAPDEPRVGTELLIAVSSSRSHPYHRLAGTERTNFVRERQGQLGYVLEYTVDLTYPGEHSYTFYVDSTIPCKRIQIAVREALGVYSGDGNGNGDSSNDNGSNDNGQAGNDNGVENGNDSASNGNSSSDGGNENDDGPDDDFT